MKKIITIFILLLSSTVVLAHNKVVVIPLFSNDVDVSPALSKTLNMIVIMDRSGSMLGANWDGAKAGLSDLFVEPSSTGINVGVNFFPVQSASDQCDAAEHNPIQVPFGELTMYAPTLIVALENQSPTGTSTPTYPALHGALVYATNFKDANPNREVIVVLITDGSPSSCNTDPVQIANLASAALNYNGVLTYTVALQGSNLTYLNSIAASGGTGQAYDATSNISLLRAKMDEIIADALDQ